MAWLMLSYQLLCLQILLLHSLSYANLCSHDQSSALLHFKQLFSFYNESSSSCDFEGVAASYPKMKYWEEDTDCCSWDGVACDRVTGHVIGIDLNCSWIQGSIPSNSSLFLLSHLKKLNLAFNDFSLSRISSDFARFPSLTHLNLSSSNFSGKVPLEISHFSKLISLDLSGDLTIETLVMKRLVQNMTELEELDLDDVITMSSAVPRYLSNLSSSLTLLSLKGCELRGSFPENIFHLPNLHTLEVNWTSPLRYLDVSSTQFSGELPHSIRNLNSLLSLLMEGCNFIGSIPASIGNLTQLSYLDLSDNTFSGQIPLSLSNLEQLIELDFSENDLSNKIPDVFTNLTQLYSIEFAVNSLSGSIPSSLVRGLQNLAYINIEKNSLDGTIPSGCFTLPSLGVIQLRDNQLTGHFEFHCTLLYFVDLSYNNFHGPIRSSIFELVNLTLLDLSSNNLSGTLELYLLDLSNNSLSLSTTNKFNSSCVLCE